MVRLKPLLGNLFIRFTYLKRHSLWLCFFVLPIQAWELSIGPSYHFFHYQETDDQGHTLNRETGYLFGVNGGLLQVKGDNEFNAYLQFLGGRVDYKGQTQLGASLATHTDQRIFRTGLKYVKTRMDFTIPLTIEVGIERNYWRRDIQPVSNVSGLIEDYHWWLASFGLGYSRKSNRWVVGVNRQFSAYMDVRETACTSEIRVFPKEDDGLYFKWKRTEQKHFGFQSDWEIAYEVWRMTRSDSVSAIACGIPIQVHEPDNQTQLLSMSYRLIF